MSADYSRTERLASAATGVSGDLLTHLERQVVTVSCDGDEANARAARILLTTLRRLPIALAFNPAGVHAADVEAIRYAVFSVDPDRPLQLEPADGFRIHLGVDAPAAVLRVIPSRHGAHVVRDDRRIDPAPASRLGSCVAAAFAATEVFKVVIDVRTDRRADIDYYAFCPVTLTDRPEDAPSLTSEFYFSGALVGLGAVGSATAMILGELSTSGDIDLIDRQQYAKENVSTYSLGGGADAAAAVWKTQLAERALTGAACHRFDDGIDAYIARVQDGRVNAPHIVLAGLDSVEARHETQRLWPDFLIDGATGDTMLGLHVVHGAGRPCMQCFLHASAGTSSPYDRLSELTGLPIEKLREGDAVLLDEDLAGLSDEHRLRISAHVGKKICGLADAVNLTDITSEGFQPSAAFVSLAAACLVVGRLIAVQLGVEPAANFIQYDALFGPGGATIETRAPSADCYCVTRRGAIERVRDERFASIEAQATE